MPQSVAHLTASDDGSGNSKGGWLTRFATAAAQLPAAHRHPLATHLPPTFHHHSPGDFSDSFLCGRQLQAGFCSAHYSLLISCLPACCWRYSMSAPIFNGLFMQSYEKLYQIMIEMYPIE